MLVYGQNVSELAATALELMSLTLTNTPQEHDVSKIILLLSNESEPPRS